MVNETQGGVWPLGLTVGMQEAGGLYEQYHKPSRDRREVHI
jgi:hypothetical protein